MTGGSGHCFCGGVTFAFTGAPRWQAHCHCESCRRATAAPMTSFLGVKDGHWRWTGDTPRLFESSSGVRRYFCGRCGSQMAYEADRFPGEIHFYAATLDRPDDYVPTFHVFAGEGVSWLKIDDDLRRYSGTAGTPTIDP
ncbi:MAG: GFA family protein [Pseudomonadota bacterium]